MTTVAELIKGYGPDFPPLEELFGLEPEEADLIRLAQPTPAMGRYFRDVAFLQGVTSQQAVALLRFRVMIEYFIALADELTAYQGERADKRVVHSLSAADKRKLRRLARSTSDILRAELIEKFTEHDTAAAGDYLKILIARELPHLEPMIEGVAFAITSEDTMSIVFGLIGNQLVYGSYLPKLLELAKSLLDYAAHFEAAGPLVLPGLTHEQAAEPTTLGKKMVTYLKPLFGHLGRLQAKSRFRPFSGKFGGAIGNFTNHRAAYRDIDWPVFGERFVRQFGLTYHELTFQASTYDDEAFLFTQVAHTLTPIIKLVDDLLRLASCPGQLFVKRKKSGTKGSSAMPNKSNGWAMEGALKMLKKAQTDLLNLAFELPNYPHEGNMGRSFLLRDMGNVFMPAFIALSRIQGEFVGDLMNRGYAPNQSKIDAFFDEYPGMAGSSLQTVLKLEGFEGDAYRDIEKIAINPDGSYANRTQFMAGLEGIIKRHRLTFDVGDALLALTDPANNIGDASFLAQRWQKAYRYQIRQLRQQLKRLPNPLARRWFAAIAA